MSEPDQHAAEADAIADAVCRRRLLHCGLTVLAAWLVCGALLRAGGFGASSPWPLIGAVAVTASAAGLATWALWFGDRRVWSQAFGRATASRGDHRQDR